MEPEMFSRVNRAGRGLKLSLLFFVWIPLIQLTSTLQI